MPVSDGAHRITRLPGGACVITAPMRERASAAVAVMLAAGSRQESPAEAGLAHFIEHMVFKGSERYPSAKAISEAVERVGGVINAATDKEMTMFWAKVPAAELGLAVDVLSDMVFGGLYDAAEVAKERLVVIEELRMYLDNPQDHVATLFEEVMWPEHPLGIDTAGTEETVRSFEREDCLRFLGRHYHGDRVVVTITGAIDHDEALERVAPAIRSWGDGPVPEGPAAVPVPDSAPRLRLVAKKTEQANICIGARSRSYLDPDRFAVDLMTTVLGDGMSSRLFLALREERALAYDAHAFTVKHRDTGAVGIYIGCEPRRAKDALSAAIAELTRLAEEPVPDAEMAKARTYTTGRLLLQLESTSSMCTYLGQQQVLAGEILTPAEVVAAVEAVSADDVRRMARETLAAGLRGAIIGPFRNPDVFLKKLA